MRSPLLPATLPALLALGACTAAPATDKTTDTQTDGYTDEVSDGYTDTDTDTTDTDSGGPPPLNVSVTGLSWTLLEMESLVNVAWTQDEAAAVHIEYSVDDGVWMSSPAISRPAGTHEQLIVGIPFQA